jgi:hypothetical protein
MDRTTMNPASGLGGPMQFQISTGMSDTSISDTSMSKRSEENVTQLKAIRELMLAHSLRNNWLTLGEIADVTEFGEASISAQLRHLRKARYGRFRVEKRRRQASQPTDSGENEAINCTSGLWEYCVLPPS